MLQINQIIDIVAGSLVCHSENTIIEYLLLDSRKISIPSSSLFFAIQGVHHDGHRFIGELYHKGIRNFILEKVPQDLNLFQNCNIILVDNAVCALQQIVEFHRNAFALPVLGITGSNGKTIVKEWLTQLLSKDYNVVRSPKSYNSQIGVPLSVWEINDQHQFGIFEAGISRPGEMERLEPIIKPKLGIFTNIGPAHDEGFASREEKIKEKLLLFKHSKVIFSCADHKEIATLIKSELPDVKNITWSFKRSGDLVIKDVALEGNMIRIHAVYNKLFLNLALPFSDEASLENLMHCILVLLYLDVKPDEIQSRLNALQKVEMRLELKEGINGCYVIDDTYNNDLAGLTIALNFLDQQKQKEEKTVILSDLLETGRDESHLYAAIGDLLLSKGVKKLIGVGPTITRNADLIKVKSIFYPDTASFLSDMKTADFNEEIVLVKGARIFRFEEIVKKLQQKVHGTVFEVNLDSLSSNLNFYRSRLGHGTKIMVMVKAFAYGSGSYEVANLLQFHRVDYLAVAYADEGVALREHGVSLPVMVMNPSLSTFDKLFQYNLEPEIYSFKILKEYLEFIKANDIASKIHLKLDTGMRRLGFEEKDLKDLVGLLKSMTNIRVASVFTHLAGADEGVHDEFTQSQIEKFKIFTEHLKNELGYSFLRHALNSAGIIRFPDAQMDMVRLGIGLYGIEAGGLLQDQVQAVGTLKTIISQIKEIKKGETVGYGRKGIAERDLRIGTIAIGYADGYDRRFSNGKGKVLIQDKLCPVIGNVCMDMCMIDITETNAREGDEVVVFGKKPSLRDLSQAIGTIPYEILTSVGQRVKRVFYSE
ncbi:bifunctional UDP-N-acetylmuramoyl-tripeptide:D-alanyl-D-alanine ligase/alanine racemase [Sporocytophaga myxococcoides]|uniref:bifunctional UDP-N-acetylmuramoyl-tripeptide:D-alanyl-D-alanine ligase/alanine racemase n=1 Tax=Sporocytophaga myxococcoides TaxID=153721 RepID=UPI00049016FA|nr:bifunctional UDP-N-acetylmuramoyl-tripeptide:D-alanyl-D-alanine ligase/alanine racemase [Sporocytophaga myxococcoides]